jgi:hypothetical protein
VIRQITSPTPTRTPTPTATPPLPRTLEDGIVAAKGNLGRLGWEGYKTYKIAIRRIQYSPRRCFGTIVTEETNANGGLLSVVDHDRELHQAEIKLTNLRTLDVLQMHLGHRYDQAVDCLDGGISCCAL